MNDRYVMHDGTDGEVVLREKYFPATGTRAMTRKIRLLLPGPGLAFKLDYDQVELQRKKSKPPLFHFLDDTAKPWSKRCDFVIFYVNARAFHADCIEFKSKSLSDDKIVPQLKAGTCWVNTLKRSIEHYTGDKRKIRLRKFVFAENENPGLYIDGNLQLNADPCHSLLSLWRGGWAVPLPTFITPPCRRFEPCPAIPNVISRWRLKSG